VRFSLCVMDVAKDWSEHAKPAPLGRADKARGSVFSREHHDEYALRQVRVGRIGRQVDAVASEVVDPPEDALAVVLERAEGVLGVRIAVGREVIERAHTIEDLGLVVHGQGSDAGREDDTPVGEMLSRLVVEEADAIKSDVDLHTERKC